MSLWSRPILRARPRPAAPARGVVAAGLLLALAGCPSSTPEAPPAPPASTPAPQVQATAAPTRAPATPAPPVEPAPIPPLTPPTFDPGPPVSPEDQALAKQLNKEGYRLYTEKRYPEAIDKFEAAMKADPAYALPPYNLACTLCLVRGGEGTCANDAYKDRILTDLERSVALDPARLERARTDADLGCVHDTLRFQRLMGLNPADPAHVPQLLTAITWYGPAMGAFGNTTGLVFKADGTVTYWALEVTDEVKRHTYKGTWVVRGAHIDLRFTDVVTRDGQTGFTGVLTPTGIETDAAVGPFSDIPSECSA